MLKVNLLLASSALLTVSAHYSVASAECWRATAVGNIDSQTEGQIYNILFQNDNSDETAARTSVVDQCDAWRMADKLNRGCTAPDSYQLSCGAPEKAESQSKSPVRQWAENVLHAGAVVVAFKGGLSPEAIAVAASIDASGMKIIDWYDKDRGDVKAFIDQTGAKVGDEIGPEKIKGWVANPADSYDRGDAKKVIDGITGGIFN